MSDNSREEAASPVLNRLKSMLASDEHRVSVQTTAAVLLAFGATLFMGRENMTWGVFSALFVVQATVGGTLRSGMERILGAILGAAIGVAAVLLPMDGLQGTTVSLLLGVSVMSLVAARWPKFAYGLVTMTIIIVAPDFYVVEGALEKLVAIAIGSACGVVAAAAVFPVSARRRAEYHLSQALRACGRLQAEYVRRLVDNEDDSDAADTEVAYALSRARDMSIQARSERTPMAKPDGSYPELLNEVERFRYTLTLIDRFSDARLCDGLHEACSGLDVLCGEVNKQIDHLADAIVARKPCEPVPEVKACFEQLCCDVDQAVQDSDLTQPDRERLIAVKEAYAAMVQNLMRLCERVTAQYGA